MAADSPNLLGSVMNLAQTWSVPFANKLAYGESAAGAQAAEQQKLYWNALNGSGPNDPEASTQAPQSMQDFINGPGGTPSPTVVNPGMGMMLIPALLGIALVAVLFIFRKG